MKNINIRKVKSEDAEQFIKLRNMVQHNAQCRGDLWSPAGAQSTPLQPDICAYRHMTFLIFMTLAEPLMPFLASCVTAYAEKLKSKTNAEPQKSSEKINFQIY